MAQTNGLQLGTLLGGLALLAACSAHSPAPDDEAPPPLPAPGETAPDPGHPGAEVPGEPLVHVYQARAR